jgi:Family of unknown function (DUF6416)/TIR domain
VCLLAAAMIDCEGAERQGGIMTVGYPAASSRIFISYRREDAGYPAGWLYDVLVSHFGADRVFKDVDSIEPGDDFAEVVGAAVGSCSVLLAVIGVGWLAAADDDGQRRLDDPSDLVRLEIETALRREIRVIPVLVAGARIPRRAQLPASLEVLAGRQAVELSYARFSTDLNALIKVLDKALTSGPSAPAEPQSPGKAGDETHQAAARTPLTLHQALVVVLRENYNRPMTAQQLAVAVSQRGLYRMRDGSHAPASEIHARTSVYQDLFEKKDGRIWLRQWPPAPTMLPPSIARFEDDDDGFAAWREDHPGGYFINTERSPRSRYLKLHRAGCPHFTAEGSIHWTKAYVKICSPSRADLENWAQDTSDGDLTVCRTCFRHSPPKSPRAEAGWDRETGGSAEAAAGISKAVTTPRETAAHQRAAQRSGLAFNDDDPIWERHSGKDGHRGQEWVPTDHAQAEAFYLSLAGRARFIFDLLIDHPGELIDADKIRELRPSDFPSRQSVAASLSGLRGAFEASGRRYPFYWWAGKQGGPTQYAMKKTVANLFRDIRR